MAIFHEIHRPRTLDDAVRSGDNALNVLIIVLLVAFGVATWYFYATPMADLTNTGMATISEPMASQSSPNAGATHPAPSPDPGP